MRCKQQATPHHNKATTHSLSLWPVVCAAADVTSDARGELGLFHSHKDVDRERRRAHDLAVLVQLPAVVHNSVLELHLLIHASVQHALSTDSHGM